MTTGHEVEEAAQAYSRQNDDYNAIMIKALADRLAEAFADIFTCVCVNGGALVKVRRSSRKI